MVSQRIQRAGFSGGAAGKRDLNATGWGQVTQMVRGYKKVAF